MGKIQGFGLRRMADKKSPPLSHKNGELMQFSGKRVRGSVLRSASLLLL